MSADRGKGVSAGPMGLAALSGLLGATGVALAAIAAHRLESPTLVTASNMLMVHAAAGLGLAALVAQTGSRALAIASFVLLTGVSLFSSAVVFHAVNGSHIFPGAAPFGGSLTIATWAVIGLICGYMALRH